MRPERTLTGMTQTGTMKFTWARSESMKWLHETGTRLQIGMNVYMKHAGSSYFSFVVCFIVPFIVKCTTANKIFQFECLLLLLSENWTEVFSLWPLFYRDPIWSLFAGHRRFFCAPWTLLCSLLLLISLAHSAVGPKSVCSYFSNIVLRNCEYNFTRSPLKSRPLASHSVFDASSASNKS